MSDSTPEPKQRCPPFEAETQLNSTSLIPPLIPGQYIPLTESSRFLHSSLTQRKANAIHRHLWHAGTPGLFRALHEQYVFRRKIIVSEDPSLHLVWFSDIIYIKPLPPCLTNHEFFQEHICGDDSRYRLACGLLYSYIKLIQYESDYKIAINLGLVRSENLTWEKWQQFRLSLLNTIKADPDIINERYLYGELRLSRLNFIYAFRQFHPSGYHNAYIQYIPYFSRYFAAAILVFAFASVSLSAMQVAIQVPGIHIPTMLATTCYRFSVAALIAVVAMLITMIGIFIPILYWDVQSGFVANKRLARELRQRGQV